MKLTPRQRTVALAASNRQLKREITRRKAAEQALLSRERHYGALLEQSRLMQESLRRLSHQILSVQEEERKKISRDLHDEIVQTLTGISVTLATLKQDSTVSTSDLGRKIAATQRLVEHSMKSVHRFARELRPPLLDDLGLIAALNSYMKSYTLRTPIRINFKASAAVENLSSPRRLVLYRIAQEALTNVAKHAHASLVHVTIEKLPGSMRMEIHDNGRSFRADQTLSGRRSQRLGLIGMRERVEMIGGSFSIESEPGKGTTIRAQIPHSRRTRV